MSTLIKIIFNRDFLKFIPSSIKFFCVENSKITCRKLREQQQNACTFSLKKINVTKIALSFQAFNLILLCDYLISKP